jgi:protein-tyrosine phosphatase
VKIVFICHGNICRSAMAEQVARAYAEARGLDFDFDSAGISDEEHGNRMDRRAADVLKTHGYPVGDHRAHKLTREEARDADLLVVAERYHQYWIEKHRPDAAPIKLITDFDPEARPGDPLPDPWYGTRDDFEETLAVLERAIPVLLS